MDGGVVGDPGPDRVPRAAIDEELVAKRDDAALVIETDLDLVQLVA